VKEDGSVFYKRICETQKFVSKALKELIGKIKLKFQALLWSDTSQQLYQHSKWVSLLVSLFFKRRHDFNVDGV